MMRLWLIVVASAAAFRVAPTRKQSFCLSMNSHSLEDNTPEKLSGQPHFLHGEDLLKLRRRVLNMRKSLEKARERGNTVEIRRLTRSILHSQQFDAEFMYGVHVERTQAAASAGLWEEAEQYRKLATTARNALPQFQLEGLWVGKYGDHFQMVNVTYVGDTLLARKITGDPSDHVPKGELSFTVDFAKPDAALEPITLDDPTTIKQWGTKYLSRFAGQGQVASAGFTNPSFLPGQLILVSQYFSFAWESGHQVFFGRPSPSLTLKLLRDSPRQHLERCYEESTNTVTYYDQAGCFE